MTAGFDELVDYLLSEVALCGVQGMSDPLHHFFFWFTRLSIFFMSVHSSLSLASSRLTAAVRDARIALLASLAAWALALYIRVRFSAIALLTSTCIFVNFFVPQEPAVQTSIALSKRISSSHSTMMHPNLRLIPSLVYHPVV